MKKFISLGILLFAGSLHAQTPADILGQVATSTSIAFPTIQALAQDPYDAFSSNLAASRIGLSANPDSSHFFLTLGVQNTQMGTSSYWSEDILSGTSITVTPGFSHITEAGEESSVLFTMIDPNSGLPSINPLTGEHITIEYMANTGMALASMPFGTAGIGYKRGPFYVEGAYLPISALASATTLPMGVSLTNSHMGRITVGGSFSLTQKLSANVNGGANFLDLNVQFSEDTVATIDQEGQIFTIVNDMESMAISNRLYNVNAGLGYALTKNIHVELGAMAFTSTLTMDQTGPLTLFLQTNNPIDGTVVTASEELVDLLDGEIESSVMVNPYVHVALTTKKNSLSLVMTATSVSASITL